MACYIYLNNKIKKKMMMKKRKQKTKNGKMINPLQKFKKRKNSWEEENEDGETNGRKI